MAWLRSIGRARSARARPWRSIWAWVPRAGSPDACWKAGLRPTTPVAVVENGTLPDQRGVVGRLGALRALIRESGIKGQAIIFVGEAAGRLAAGAGSAASPLALAG